LKERETIDVRIILLPTKSNVLRYADLNSFYATRDLIDHKGLIERIERLSKNLSLSKRYSHIAEQITDIVSCDPDFIPNRIYNLAPAIIYLVVRLYKLPTTRRSIAIAAKVSEPSLTKLCRLRKHNKK
jgi:transcription initiation factor TFIIIB Brf1 subunit/transcription initiation factor TFIIB